MTRAFADDGFEVLPDLVAEDELQRIDGALAGRSRVGERELLDEPWCADLARRLQADPRLVDALPHAFLPVPRARAMLMQPLLLHASSKATGTSRRRVLHFLFGPPALPCGLAWPHAPSRGRAR
jgi:hypothetical protein